MRVTGSKQEFFFCLFISKHIIYRMENLLFLVLWRRPGSCCTCFLNAFQMLYKTLRSNFSKLSLRKAAWEEKIRVKVVETKGTKHPPPLHLPPNFSAGTKSDKISKNSIFRESKREKTLGMPGGSERPLFRAMPRVRLLTV